MDESKKNEYKQKLLDLVPPHPGSIGNYAVRTQLREALEATADHLEDGDYWVLRNSLIDDGLIEQGRGKGGSVHRIPPVTAAAAIPEGAPPAALDVASVTATEAETTGPTARPEMVLYEPFHNSIKVGYVENYRIKRFISQITASQGRRLTGGRWTRPDITLVAVRTYAFTPGKRLEVITFELKPSLDSALEGVFEALAHSAFAHRSYLAVDVSSYGDSVEDERIVHECSRLGIGYITFEKPGDYETFDIVTPAKLNEPDPYEVDTFIKTQISSVNQDELREWLA